MEDLVKKISSYNLFNNLFTGEIAFLVLKMYLGFNITVQNIFQQIALVYITGIIFNRIGSIVLLPVLKKLKIINLTAHQEFVDASKKDKKIDILQQEANIYRSLSAIFIIALIIKVLMHVQKMCNWDIPINHLVIIILSILFVISYIKQTRYIVSRVGNSTTKKLPNSKERIN